jgi:hypothetical protein
LHPQPKVSDLSKCAVWDTEKRITERRLLEGAMIAPPSER